jgi:hypothetical protein
VSRAARWLRALVLAGLLAVSAGCAGATPPGETVPGLRTHLDRIDRALAERRYDVARTGLEALVRAATDARASGRLSPEQADRILAAAARLAADLPTAQPTTTTEPPPPERRDEKKDKHRGKGHDKGRGGDQGDGDGD